VTDPWHRLRCHTQARIGLGRAGHGLPTAALLDHQLAHAAARDAVLRPWNVDLFSRQAQELGVETLCLRSRATDRTEYLLQPELGRRLSEESAERIASVRAAKSADVSVTVTNGLSSSAVDEHGLALLEKIMTDLRAGGLTTAPVCLVPDGRVALSDEIGTGLSARISVIIVGERPGLSAANSLGIYLTYGPRPGNTDAGRNCISNIRPPDGLAYQAAAEKLLYLIRQAFRLSLSGVALKDDMPPPPPSTPLPAS
jgi:ethanolamine ammonia-lyase small subunit